MITLQELIQIVNLLATNLQADSSTLGPWAYVVLALTVAAEGPLATLFGGAAASTGHLNLLAVFVVATLANMVADTAWYGLGYWGGMERAIKVGRVFGLRPKHLDNFQHAIHKHTIKVLLLAKLSAALVIPSLISAGIARVPMRRWLPTILVTETLWIGGLALLGFYATETILRIESGLHTIAIIILFGLAIGAVFYIRRHLRQRSEELIAEED